MSVSCNLQVCNCSRDLPLPRDLNKTNYIQFYQIFLRDRHKPNLRHWTKVGSGYWVLNSDEVKRPWYLQLHEHIDFKCMHLLLREPPSHCWDRPRPDQATRCDKCLILKTNAITCNQISRGVKWVAGAQGGAPSRGPRGVRSRNTYDKLRHAEKYAFETDNFELEVIG